MQASPEVGALARSLGLVQGCIAVGMGVVIGLVWGKPYGFAALYGGVCAVLPMAFFAFRVAQRRSSAPAEVAGAAFRGEMGKFAMTVMLLWLGVTIFAAQFVALLASYGACLLAYWVIVARLGIESDDKG